MICIYCGENGKPSREHVWPQWLHDPETIETLRESNPELPPWEMQRLVLDQAGNHELEQFTRGRVPLLPDLVVKVCETCNNGWMAQLENAVKPLLKSMIAGDSRALTKEDQALLALWVTKTAFNYALAMQPEDRPFGDQRYSELFRTRTAPKSAIWVARSRSVRAQVAMDVHPHWLTFSEIDHTRLVEQLPTGATVYIAAHGVIFLAHFLPSQMDDLHDELVPADARFTTAMRRLWPVQPESRWPDRYLDDAELEFRATYLTRLISEAVGLPLVGLTPAETEEVARRFHAGEDVDTIWNSYPHAERFRTARGGPRAPTPVAPKIMKMFDEDGAYRVIRAGLIGAYTTGDEPTIVTGATVTRDDSAAGQLEQLVTDLEALISSALESQSPVVWHVLISSMARELVDSGRNPAHEVTFMLRWLVPQAKLSRRRSTANEVNDLLRGKPSNAQFSSLAYVIALVMIKQRIETILLRLDKTQDLQIHGDLTFEPVGDHSLAIEPALRLFDYRRMIDNATDGADGMAGLLTVEERDPDERVMLWLSTDRQPVWRSFPPAALDPVVGFAATRREVHGSVGTPRIPNADDELILRCVLNYAAGIESGKHGRWLRKLGFVFVDGKSFTSALKREVRARGTMTSVDAAPLLDQHGITLNAGKSVVIDLLAATNAYLGLPERTAGGSDGKAWGDAFEAELQRGIDLTPGKPPPHYRSLIGKTVKNPATKSDLTDIDAVACVGSRLLLISAKSFAVSEATHTGEFKAVHNYAEKVATAVAEWRRKLDVIRANPEILGLDLTPETEIEGAVVLPVPPYVEMGEATDFVPGMGIRRACSLIELLADLDSSQLVANTELNKRS